jgi:hypothetical protein
MDENEKSWQQQAFSWIAGLGPMGIGLIGIAAIPLMLGFVLLSGLKTLCGTSQALLTYFYEFGWASIKMTGLHPALTLHLSLFCVIIIVIFSEQIGWWAYILPLLHVYLSFALAGLYGDSERSIGAKFAASLVQVIYSGFALLVCAVLIHAAITG